MTHEEFDKLVRSVETGVGRDARQLRKKVFRLAVLGYAGLAAPLGIVLALSLVFIIPGLLWPVEAMASLIAGGLLLLLGGWTTGRALWVRLTPPEGRAVSRAEAPLLYEMLDELRHKLRSTRFHHVLIYPNCNAAVVQTPRLGVFGWNRNYLLLGLPLMEILSREELAAVLAHECAHLSRQHGRSGQWIYRLRRSWEQVFEKLSRPRVHGEVSLRPLIRKFVRWFWPRFNAHAFVLSRAHEYQADAVAAQLAGEQAAATALMRIKWYGRLLEEKIWPDLWQLTKTMENPPDGLFLRISESLGAAQVGSETKWLEQAFSSATTNADTHPSLSDRLRAIGWRSKESADTLASTLAPPKPNSAEILLGASLAAIRRDLEQSWRKECEPNWRQQHGKANAVNERLDLLEKTIVVKAGDTDALWDKARMFLELHDEESALPLFRRILELDPRHVAANLQLGCRLLADGNGEGEQYVERAIAEDEEVFPEASNALFAYYRLTGQSGRLRALHVRRDQYEKAMQESCQERSHVTAKDKLIAHGLTGPELEKLRGLLAADPEIIAADLGRKELKFSARQKLFLLCIHTRPKWHRFPDGDRDRAVVNRLTRAAQFPGRVLIFTPSGGFRAVARKLAKVPDARIFFRR